MKVFYMEFRSCEITEWTTDFYTDVSGVIDEVVEQWEVILDSLCWRSQKFTFDPKHGLDSLENKRAIEVFDFLMSQFALKAFEPGSFSYGSLEFKILCKPVIDNLSRNQPEQKRETQLALPC